MKINWKQIIIIGGIAFAGWFFFLGPGRSLISSITGANMAYAYAGGSGGGGAHSAPPSPASAPYSAPAAAVHIPVTSAPILSHTSNLPHFHPLHKLPLFIGKKHPAISHR